MLNAKCTFDRKRPQDLVAPFPLVPGDDAVLDVDHAVRVLGDVVLVRDQHDGVAFCPKAIE